MDPLSGLTTRPTPHRSEPPAPSARQKPNAAGGFGFALDDDTRVHRFLTLGTDGGTFHAASAT